MNNQTLLIHEKFILFDILTELREEFGFSIIKFNEKDLKKLENLNNLNNLFITQKKIKNVNNQIVLDTLPVNILKLSEKINFSCINKV